MAGETENFLGRGLFLEYITLGWNVVGVMLGRKASRGARLDNSRLCVVDSFEQT